MKLTPEQIKQIAIECGYSVMQPFDYGAKPYNGIFTFEQLQAFFTRAYELGWKNRGESDAICPACGGNDGDAPCDSCPR